MDVEVVNQAVTITNDYLAEALIFVELAVLIALGIREAALKNNNGKPSNWFLAFWVIVISFVSSTCILVLKLGTDPILMISTTLVLMLCGTISAVLWKFDLGKAVKESKIGDEKTPAMKDAFGNFEEMIKQGSAPSILINETDDENDITEPEKAGTFKYDNNKGGN